MGCGASSKAKQYETLVEPLPAKAECRREAWAEAPTLSKFAGGGDLGLVMAADVGGTNSRLMLYEIDTKSPVELRKPAPGKLLFRNKYSNVAFSSFADVVAAFLEDSRQEGVIGADIVPEVACLAVAGVAQANVARLSNLDWLIDGGELQDRFGFPVLEVCNDFAAQGYGVLTLDDTEVVKLTGGEPTHSGVIAVIGPGTGLGQCFLAPSTTGEYQCFPSEGGHVELAPRGAGCDETQIELLKFLKVKFAGYNRVSFERVVSGKGICAVYEFLAFQNPKRIDKKVHAQYLASSRIDASIVTLNATPGSLCEEALKIFASCYGCVAGSLALQLLPFGGVYLTGGVGHRLQDFLRDEGSFLEAFYDKGRVSNMLEDIPVFFVKGDQMGERGAHLRAVRLLHHRREGLALPVSKPSKQVHLPPPRDRNFAEFLKLVKVKDAFMENVTRRGSQVDNGADPLQSVSRQLSKADEGADDSVAQVDEVRTFATHDAME